MPEGVGPYGGLALNVRPQTAASSGPVPSALSFGVSEQLNGRPHGAAQTCAGAGAEDEVIESESRVGLGVPHHVGIARDGEGLDFTVKHVLEASTDQARVATNLEASPRPHRAACGATRRSRRRQNRPPNGVVHDGAGHVHAAGHLDALKAGA